MEEVSNNTARFGIINKPTKAEYKELKQLNFEGIEYKRLNNRFKDKNGNKLIIQGLEIVSIEHGGGTYFLKDKEGYSLVKYKL